MFFKLLEARLHLRHLAHRLSSSSFSAAAGTKRRFRFVVFAFSERALEFLPPEGGFAGAPSTMSSPSILLLSRDPGCCLS